MWLLNNEVIYSDLGNAQMSALVKRGLSLLSLLLGDGILGSDIVIMASEKFTDAI